MDIEITENPREFRVNNITLKDFGKISLAPNEMVSFKTKSNKEFDFVAKEWGFYATPSINGRLKNEGFKTALVLHESNRLYIMVVEEDKLDKFNKYLEEVKVNKLICWLDEWFSD